MTSTIENLESIKRPPAAAETVGEACELSIVMPCLNEADTIVTCVGKARRALAEQRIDGEVIVADNGSTDGSIELAIAAGARVVQVATRGYGSAVSSGVEVARGKFILMGDADDSYDFLDTPRFLEKIRQGCDLVQGCRLPQGGGTIAPRAMPWSHRWIGNPIFSLLVRKMFAAPVHDVNCGMRIFSRECFRRLDLRCVGMEFAVEMIIKAALHGEKIEEIPITLHRDGRTSHPPHLRTFRDGWRELRFFLMLSPRWLFLVPGLGLILLGLLGYALAMPAFRIHGVRFDVNTLLCASLAVILGFQSVWFALFTKVFAITERLLPPDPRLMRAFDVLTLERGLLVGAMSALSGFALLCGATILWYRRGFGDFDYAYSLRWVIPGVTLVILGCQTILSSFFISILGMRRR